jgi:hypothetical protein
MLTYQESVTILPWAFLLWAVIMGMILVISNRSLEVDELGEALKRSHTSLKEKIEAIHIAPLESETRNALLLLLDERIESLCGSYNQLTSYIAAHDARISYLGVLKCTEKGAPIPKEWGIDEIAHDLENDSVAIRNMKLDHYIGILQTSREQNWATYGWMASQIQKYAEAKMDILGVGQKGSGAHVKVKGE